jgi:DNA-binding MarR family transcriptional regulator
LRLNKIASPATLHRKLDELREAGLIQQVFEGKDRRTKYLVPTKEADAYFAKMSKAITSAVNA